MFCTCKFNRYSSPRSMWFPSFNKCFYWWQMFFPFRRNCSANNVPWQNIVIVFSYYLLLVFFLPLYKMPWNKTINGFKLLSNPSDVHFFCCYFCYLLLVSFYLTIQYRKKKNVSIKTKIELKINQRKRINQGGIFSSYEMSMEQVQTWIKKYPIISRG